MERQKEHEFIKGAEPLASKIDPTPHPPNQPPALCVFFFFLFFETSPDLICIPQPFLR